MRRERQPRRQRRKSGAGERRVEAQGGTRAAARAPEPEDPTEVLIARARRFRERGELRRAIVALREACAREEMNARSWTLLGALLTEDGRGGEARSAFKHALWLRGRAGEPGREAVTRALLERASMAA